MLTHNLNIKIEGSGPTLVLIHGVAGSLRIWDYIVPYLIDHYTICRVDLLGYGHSPKPHIRYAPEVQVNAIRDTLQAHDISTPFTIIGLSMGTNLALEYTARWPPDVSGFIGIGFPYYADEAMARHSLHNDFWARVTLEWPRLARLFVPPIWWLARVGILPSEKFTPIYSKAMARDALRSPHFVFAPALRECMLHNRLDPLLSASGSMDKLFIHGADDTWSSASQVRQALTPYKHSELVILPSTGHNTVVVNPNETSRHILAYLAKQYS